MSSRDMVSIFRDTQCAAWVKDGPPVLDSRGIQRRHAEVEPTTNYQLQKINIFLAVRETSQGKSPSLKHSKDVFQSVS